ncbi:glucan-binding YG repeat protein [Hungatella effluvii]|uniref:Glucan-binding YG repeat protein n=1 Tax=Hungatella effluvii TaxID=1096246 RepID=A0A2V3XV29_9FIRM|nr:hypothetical protein [Hungatella effluvii]PXX42343.1 glucan-binding YG repeat protein [Hungatella effluvii]
MRKQTKLVAVLSAAALLAIGASMTSFAATGWAEENGTWVYYDKDGNKVTDEWKKSGNNWFYLNDDGEMATETLVEDDDNYYYVDANGVMVANRWVQIANEDDDDEDAPDSYWYFFQSNGKAYTAPSDNDTSFKNINGKKYAFDEEGKMLFGWVNGSSTRMTDDEDWKNEDTLYYCGGQDDGARATGWAQIHVIDTEEDDEDQDYWFWFQSNGKKLMAEDGNNIKEKTINGKKYGFNSWGKMVSGWSDDATNSDAATPANGADYKYFSSAEDGARKTKGWFKVVPSSGLNSDDHDTDTENWYYADGKGFLYASVLKSINGKTYAFDEDGAMINGLVCLDVEDNVIRDIIDDDIDTEDNLDSLIESGVGAIYYFGNGEDGSMKTGTQNLTIDGDSFTFLFNKSGDNKGQGVTGLKDKAFYTMGKKVKASSDDKYVIVSYEEGKDGDADTIKTLASKNWRVDAQYVGKNKDGDSIKVYTPDEKEDYYLVTTSGSIVTSKKNAKDGNDWYFDVTGSRIEAYKSVKNTTVK